MGFRLRLFLSILVLIGITSGIGGTVLISASFQDSLKKATSSALESYETVQRTLYLYNSLGEKTNYRGLADALEQISEQKVAHWQALSLRTEQELIYQSGDEKLFSQKLPPPKAKQCVYTNVADAYGYGIQVFGIVFAGKEQLLLEARFDMSPIYESRSVQQRLFFIIYGVMVLLGSLLAGILSFGLTRRLRRLTEAVGEISEGNLSKRSGIFSKDEFGQLSKSFDDMVDRLEENMKRLEMTMERQEAFMGAFAHEMKTPMTAIIGYADLLRQGDMEENTCMMAADYIFSEGKRVEKLSFQLLELFLLKKDSFIMKEVYLPVFVQEIEKALTPMLAEKRISFQCSSPEGTACFEPDLVKSLIYNLVDNGAKAIDETGKIMLKLSLISGGCQIQVTDSGRGMENEELGKITEAFYRVDKSRSRKQGGAGLGLALCRQIVELHNGAMEYTSSPGAGTSVKVTLYGKGKEAYEENSI